VSWSAGFTRHAARASEVIRMRVGHDDGVDVFHAVTGRLQPLLQRLPRLRTGQSRIDDGEAAVVDQAVHVDVAQTRHPDRELHAQYAGCDLGDLFRRGLLFLSQRTCARLDIGHAGQGIVRPRKADRVGQA